MEILIIVASLILLVFAVSRIVSQKTPANINTTMADSKMQFEPYKLFLAAKNENKEWSRQHSILMEHQNNGMNCEKAEDISNAIQSYEQCVQNGESFSMMKINNYLYSIERLAILYRKTKQYDKEVAIIKFALKHELHANDRVKLQNRLSKAEQLTNSR
jgi:hypothetical protein